MVTAGIHGSERASIIAAKKILILLQNNAMRINKGMLIIVPIVNKNAYHLRIRGTPDLNRTFPRRHNEATRHSLSAALFRLAKHYQPAWYIDLHEANGFSKVNPRFLGQSLIVNPRSKVIPIAEQIVSQMNRSIAKKSTQFSLLFRNLPGSGRTAAYRLLKSNAVTVETSCNLPFSVRVNYQLKILCNILDKAGLIKGDLSQKAFVRH